VFIPHIYNSERKKTFFFYNEEWRREVTGVSTSSIKIFPRLMKSHRVDIQLRNPNLQPGNVPHCAHSLRSGFGRKARADGLTMGQPFPNNTIPANLLDANALLFNNTKNLQRRQTRTVPTPRPAVICLSRCVRICSVSITTSTTSGSSLVTTS